MPQARVPIVDKLTAEDARTLRTRQRRTIDYIDDQMVLMSILSSIREVAGKNSSLSYVGWIPKAEALIWQDLRDRGFKLSFPSGGSVWIDWSK